MTLNNSSTDKAKLSISQRLGTLYAIAKGLEAFGVTITTAQASRASYDYILVFAHDVKAFSAWMKKRNLVPVFEELGEDEMDRQHGVPGDDRARLSDRRRKGGMGE